MHKSAERLRNVFRRIAQPLSRLESTTKLVLGLIGLLSTGFAGWDLQRAQPWLLDDWTHVTVAVVGLGFLGAFLALYGLETDLDRMRVVQVEVTEKKAEVLPILHFNLGASAADVFALDLRMNLRNDSDRATRAFFPNFELLGKGDAGPWMTIPLSYRELGGRGQPKGSRGQGDLWFPTQRFEIPERDEIVVHFWILGTAPGGADAFLRKDLKLKLTVDVIGQPKTLLEIPLPRINEVSS